MVPVRLPLIGTATRLLASTWHAMTSPKSWYWCATSCQNAVYHLLMVLDAPYRSSFNRPLGQGVLHRRNVQPGRHGLLSPAT